MPRNSTTGIFTRVNNSFSNPVQGTVIDPNDANALFNDQDIGLTFNDASPLILIGSTSGVTKIIASDTASGTVTLPSGSTDFSSTGGTNQFLKQETSGGPFTVGTIDASQIVGNAVINVAKPVTKTTLQAAVDQAAAAFAAGLTAIVQIPAGSWSVDTSSGPVSISTGSMIIQGVSNSFDAGSVLVTTNAANHLFSAIANESITFRDLAITSSVVRASDTAGIYINEAPYSGNKKTISSVVIFGQYDAIRIDAASEYSIIDSSLLSFTHAGIVLDNLNPATPFDVGGGVIEFNKIWDVTGTSGAKAGIIWHKGSGVRINNNRILGAFEYGLWVNFDNVNSDDGAMIVTGNTFEVQTKAGIYVDQTAGSTTAAKTIGQMVIANNHFQALTSGYLIPIWLTSNGVGNWVDGAIISSNILEVNIGTSFNAGIELDGVNGATISGNVIYNNGSGVAGIRVSGTSTGIQIATNKMVGAGSYSINAGTTIVDTGNIFTVATLPSAAANGSMLYTSDGTPGATIAGSGTGAYALRVNGVWQGMASPAFGLNQFASTTSAQLAGVISDETGTGPLVFSNNPVFIAPTLGTPASGVATNLTGTAAGLTAGSVTTNANLTGVITSVGNATSITSQTGTGTKFVVDTNPAIIGGSHTSMSSLTLRDTAAAFDLGIVSTDATMAANRTLTINTLNGSRSATLGGNFSLGGDFSTSGTSALTLTTTATTNATLPPGTTTLAASKYTTQIFTSGTAATYTTPSGARFLKITAWGGGGGGGGGAGSSTSGGNGGAGTQTSFSTLTAPGGGGGVGGGPSGNIGNPAAGGAAGVVGAGTFAFPGFPGASTAGGTSFAAGGAAGGGQGGGAGGTVGGAGAAGSSPGGGGGGGGSNNNAGGAAGGAGGGSGARTELIISPALAATYTYTVGTGGTAGAAGTGGTSPSAGGVGGAGYIIVEEFY